MSSVGSSRSGRRVPEAPSQPAVDLRNHAMDDFDEDDWEAPSSGHAAARPGEAVRNLNYAILSEADLRGADLTQADLTGAELTRADLRGANLQDASLWGACLRGARLEGADLLGADLHLAILKGSTFNTETRWPSGFEPHARGALLTKS
jgi:uncharacterized protein YjbI with pentapeptide repeats